jgi:hypothetical protein
MYVGMKKIFKNSFFSKISRKLNFSMKSNFFEQTFWGKVFYMKKMSGVGTTEKVVMSTVRLMKVVDNFIS